MGGFECERVDMRQLALCVACSTGSYQEAQRVKLNQKLRPVLRAEFFCCLTWTYIPDIQKNN